MCEAEEKLWLTSQKYGLYIIFLIQQPAVKKTNEPEGLSLHKLGIKHRKKL